LLDCECFSELTARKLTGSNFFEGGYSDDDGAAGKKATKDMKSLTTLSEVRFPEEAVCYPVFWCGKFNSTTVVGLFAIRVDT